MIGSQALLLAGRWATVVFLPLAPLAKASAPGES
jgi:hypothetical protein